MGEPPLVTRMKVTLACARLGASPAGQATFLVRSASRHGDDPLANGDATTYYWPPATSTRWSYRAEPHVNSATASVSSWSRDGSRMVTTISGTRPGLPEPTRTILDCLVALLKWGSALYEQRLDVAGGQ